MRAQRTPSRAPRARVGATALAIGAILLTGCAAAFDPYDSPSLVGPTGPATPAAALTSTGPATVIGACAPNRQARTTPAAVSTVFAGLNHLPYWQSADVGITVPLVDGRVLWVFGDTLRAVNIRPRFAENSMLMWSNSCVSQPVPAGRGAFIRPTVAGTACWPSAAFTVPSNDGNHLHVACSRIRRGPGGLFDFAMLGTTMAQFDVPRGGAPRLMTSWQVSADEDNPLQTTWGAAMWSDGVDAYIYGTQLTATGSSSCALLVARVGVRDIADRTQWRYWNGSSWANDAAAAQPVIQGAQGVSQALSIIKTGNGFAAISKVGGDFGADVGVWTAPTPNGPWTLGHTQRVPFDDSSGELTYQPLAHPEIPIGAGQLLVSLSRNPKSLANLAADPHRGRPMFIEVPAP